MENIRLLHPIKGLLVKRGKYITIREYSFCVIHDKNTVMIGLPGANDNYLLCRTLTVLKGLTVDDGERQLVLLMEQEFDKEPQWPDGFDKKTYKAAVKDGVELHEEYKEGLIESAKAYQYLLP